MKKLNNKLEYLVPSLSLLAFYLTASKDLVDLDSGELIAAQYFWGLPHPTGYPYYILLCHLLLKLKIFSDIAHQANLISSVYSAISIFFLVKSLKLILENNNTANNKNSLSYFIILFYVLTFIFSKNFWLISIQAEVYSFQFLIISIFFYLILRNIFSDKCHVSLFFILFGLGISHHLTSLFLLPLLLFVFFEKKDFSFATIIQFIKYFSFSLSIYLLAISIIFIRSNQEPILNYGMPNNLRNLLYYTLASQFDNQKFQFNEVFIKNSFIFIKSLFSNFTILFLLFFLLGTQIVKIKYKSLSIAIFISLIMSIFFIFSYDVNDIEYYFIYPFFLLWFVGSFFALNGKIKTLKIFAMLIILNYQLFSNILSLNFSKKNYTRIYYDIATSEVESRTIIFCKGWGGFPSASLYYQQVLNKKKDIFFIEYELLPTNWYIYQLMRLYPELNNIIDSAAFKRISGIFKKNELTVENANKIFELLLIQAISKNLPIYFSSEFFIANKDYIEQLLKNYPDLSLHPINLLYKLDRKNKWYRQFNIREKLEEITQQVQDFDPLTLDLIIRVFETKRSEYEKKHSNEIL